MRKPISFLFISVLALSLFTAVDFPALPDGGSLVTSNGGLPGDGGGPWITIDTGHTEDWVPAIRCHASTIICGTASPRVNYRFSADGGTANAAYMLLDVDRTFDLPVFQPKDRKLRYLSLSGEDGGPPCCTLTQPDPN